MIHVTHTRILGHLDFIWVVKLWGQSRRQEVPWSGHVMLTCVLFGCLVFSKANSMGMYSTWTRIQISRKSISRFTKTRKNHYLGILSNTLYAKCVLPTWMMHMCSFNPINHNILIGQHITTHNIQTPSSTLGKFRNFPNCKIDKQGFRRFTLQYWYWSAKLNAINANPWRWILEESKLGCASIWIVYTPWVVFV